MEKLSARRASALVLGAVLFGYGCSAPSDPSTPAETGTETGPTGCSDPTSGSNSEIKSTGPDQSDKVGHVCGPEAGDVVSDEVGSDAAPETSPDAPDAAAPETKDASDDTADEADTAPADVTPPKDAAAEVASPEAGDALLPDAADATETASEADAAAEADATPDAPDAAETSPDAADASDAGSDAIVVAPTPFACKNIVRKPGYDGVKPDGVDIELTRNLVCVNNPTTGATDCYTADGTHGRGFVHKLDGATGLWSESLAFSPLSVQSTSMGISGSLTTGICAAGYTSGAGGAGLLFCLGSDGAWNKVTNAPIADFYNGVYVAGDSSIYLYGFNAGSFNIWRMDAASKTWSPLTFPTLVFPIAGPYLDLNSMFGIGGGNDVLVTGNFTNGAGSRNGGVLLECGVSSCTSLPVPPDSAALIDVSASSRNNIYATGITTSKAAAIYYMASQRTPWTEYVSDSLKSYSAVASPRSGVVIAAGNGDDIATAGTLSLTTWDQIFPAATNIVDTMAWNATGFSFSADGHTVRFLTMATSDYSAGFYEGDCP